MCIPLIQVAQKSTIVVVLLPPGTHRLFPYARLKLLDRVFWNRLSVLHQSIEGDLTDELEGHNRIRILRHEIPGRIQNRHHSLRFPETFGLRDARTISTHREIFRTSGLCLTSSIFSIRSTAAVRKWNSAEIGLLLKKRYALTLWGKKKKLEAYCDNDVKFLTFGLSRVSENFSAKPRGGIAIRWETRTLKKMKKTNKTKMEWGLVCTSMVYRIKSSRFDCRIWRYNRTAVWPDQVSRIYGMLAHRHPRVR